jgi:hypothetical protein
MNEEIISVYTKEQAIEDGFLADFGVFKGKNIVFTSNLIQTLKKPEIIIALIEGLAAAEKFEGPDLKEIVVGGKRVWVDYVGHDLTFMLPEDY